MLAEDGARVVADGLDVCFVGTKRQARASVEKYAQDVSMPYVIERWLGGTLTNFRTIRERLKRLEELERLVESGEKAGPYGAALQDVRDWIASIVPKEVR